MNFGTSCYCCGRAGGRSMGRRIRSQAEIALLLLLLLLLLRLHDPACFLFNGSLFFLQTVFKLHDEQRKLW